MKHRCSILLTLAALLLASEPLPAQRPESKTASAKSDKADASDKTQEVIAEGIGTTADEALKEAFRAAVQQVVGAVVDGQTRVKNDEVISDQVLTASGGFVAGYERLKIEKTGGLVRVRIKAKVEKAQLVDKLRELKINVQGVDVARVLPDDNDRRFSDDKVKAMSREEMVANKTEIIHDALVDLPKVLDARARMPDRFDYDAESGTLKVDVTVSADNERYVQLVKRLQLRLEKLSLNKKPLIATTSGKPADLTNNYFEDADVAVPGFYADITDGIDLTGHPSAWTLAMVTESLRGGAVLRWTAYVLDADVRKCLAGLHGELQAQVTLRDADGKTITEETLNLSKSGWLGWYHHRYAKEPGNDADPYHMLTPVPEKVRVTQERSVNVMLAPMAFYANFVGRTVGNRTVGYTLSRTYPLKVKLGADELKRVKDIRCAVQFGPPKNDN
jgi:hypothetical protein